jgi:hypothetical protein
MDFVDLMNQRSMKRLLNFKTFSSTRHLVLTWLTDVMLLHDKFELYSSDSYSVKSVVEELNEHIIVTS